MTDFLEEKKREINARLKELRPLVDEYHRLEAAAAALDGVGGGGAAARAGANGGESPRRARGSGGSGTTRRGSGGGASGRRGRPRGSGTRAKQGLEPVRPRPRVSLPRMGRGGGG